MAMTVTMPQLGESVTEGTIARWLKQPGELVSKYESIAEVVTDKVNAEIPSPAEGSMGEHIAREGQVVAVGEPICTIETVEQGQANSAWHQGDGEQQAPAPAEAGAEAAQPVAAGVQQEQGAAQPVAQAEQPPAQVEAPPTAPDASAPPPASDGAAQPPAAEASAPPEAAAQSAAPAAPTQSSGNGSSSSSA
ncbi:MAG: biotin/lipoyl-containing protein, partial [Candidatus Dormibacter sp.]